MTSYVALAVTVMTAEAVQRMEYLGLHAAAFKRDV